MVSTPARRHSSTSSAKPRFRACQSPWAEGIRRVMLHSRHRPSLPERGPARRAAGFSTPDPAEPESYSSVGSESDRRLRANSSARRDGTLEDQQTSLPPPVALPSIPGLSSDPDFPHRIPANIDIPRQKAGCPRNVCMPVTPGCPCAAVESTVASNCANAYRPLVQNFRIGCAALAKAPANWLKRRMPANEKGAASLHGPWYRWCRHPDSNWGPTDYKPVKRHFHDWGPG